MAGPGFSESSIIPNTTFIPFSAVRQLDYLTQMVEIVLLQNKLHGIISTTQLLYVVFHTFFSGVLSIPETLLSYSLEHAH